jgi:hypothetical protein
MLSTHHHKRGAFVFVSQILFSFRTLKVIELSQTINFEFRIQKSPVEIRLDYPNRNRSTQVHTI